MRHLLFTGRIMDLSAVRMLKPVESLGSARKPKQRDRGGRVGQHEDPGQGWESRVASFCLLLSRLTPRDVPCARRDDAVALAADRDAGPAVEVVPGRGEARREKGQRASGSDQEELYGSVRAGGRVPATFPASSQEGGGADVTMYLRAPRHGCLLPSRLR